MSSLQLSNTIAVISENATAITASPYNRMLAISKLHNYILPNPAGANQYKYTSFVYIMCAHYSIVITFVI